MMFSRILRMGLLSCAVVLLACQTAPPPAEHPNQAEVEAAIAELREAYIKAQNAGDTEGLVDLFADDAILMPAHDPAAAGKEAIRSWIQSQHDQLSFALAVSQAELEVAGHWAFTRGTYTLKVTPKAGGSTIEDKGKYLNIVAHQADGSWKLARHIWNSDQPLPVSSAR